MPTRKFDAALRCDGPRRASEGLARHRSARSRNGGGRRLRDRAAEVLKILSRRAALALLAVVAHGARRLTRRAPTLIPRGRSRWWCRSRRAAATTSWRASSASAWARRSGSRSWSRTGPAPAATSARARPRAARPTATRCCWRSPARIGINPSLYANLGYDPAKDLTPIGSIATSPAVLVVHPSLPVKTLKELIAYAKANPGQLSYASSGVGTVVHVATEMLADAAGIKVEQVPYKGTGPGITDLLGGHVKMMMPPIPAMIAYVNAGTLRAIGVTSKERSPCCRRCPPSRKRACPASSRSSATACWRRRARPGRSSSG